MFGRHPAHEGRREQSAVCWMGSSGTTMAMFVWHKRSGEPSKVRFFWWPLLLSLALSILLTIMLNTIL